MSAVKNLSAVVKTDDYTVYRKRNGKYAVRGNDRNWINGDDKVAVLAKHELISVKLPEPEPEPEPEVVEEAAAEEAPAEAAPAAEEAPAPEAGGEAGGEGGEKSCGAGSCSG